MEQYFRCAERFGLMNSIPQLAHFKPILRESLTVFMDGPALDRPAKALELATPLAQGVDPITLDRGQDGKTLTPRKRPQQHPGLGVFFREDLRSVVDHTSLA